LGSVEMPMGDSMSLCNNVGLISEAKPAKALKIPLPTTSLSFDAPLRPSLKPYIVRN